MPGLVDAMKHLRPTASDAAVVGLGTAVPFLAGAAPASGGGLPDLINMAVAAAASAAAGLIVKAGVAGAGAFIRAKVRRMKSDKDPSNDDAADALEAVADKLDPEGKPKP